MKPLLLMAVQTQFVVAAVTSTLPKPPAELKSALFGVNTEPQRPATILNTVPPPYAPPARAVP